MTSDHHQDQNSRREVQLKEYEFAQEMLRHYDSLNWQIGSILTAAAMVLTGLILDSEQVNNLLTDKCDVPTQVVVVFAVPLFTFFVMISWWWWFRRHRDLYNFRNETLHRLEAELGMYHYLRIVKFIKGDEAEKPVDGNQAGADADAQPKSPNEHKSPQSRLSLLAENAGHGASFEPFFDGLKLSGPPGHRLAQYLCFVLPLFQFTVLFTISTSIFWVWAITFPAFQIIFFRWEAGIRRKFCFIWGILTKDEDRQKKPNGGSS